MFNKLERNDVKAYREWTSNFSEGVFVMLKVYSDETGTHDDADNVHWPGYNERVLFVFDQSTNREWVGALTSIHAKCKEKDPRIGGILFEDDKDPFHIALQAADLSAICSRNNAREYLKVGGGIFDMGIVDFLVGKNIDPDFRNLPKKTTQKMIADMVEDEAFKRKNGFTGAFIPHKHFDAPKYGYKKLPQIGV